MTCWIKSIISTSWALALTLAAGCCARDLPALGPQLARAEADSLRAGLEAPFPASLRAQLRGRRSLGSGGDFDFSMLVFADRGNGRLRLQAFSEMGGRFFSALYRGQEGQVIENLLPVPDAWILDGPLEDARRLFLVRPPRDASGHAAHAALPDGPCLAWEGNRWILRDHGAGIIFEDDRGRIEWTGREGRPLAHARLYDSCGQEIGHYQILEIQHREIPGRVWAEP